MIDVRANKDILIKPILLFLFIRFSFVNGIFSLIIGALCQTQQNRFYQFINHYS